MKLKGLWVPMLLLTIVGGAVKICDTLFGLGKQQFFLDSTTCDTIFVTGIVFVLLLGFILSIADRKKDFEKVYPVKNGFGGICGFIASVSIIGSSVINLLGLGNVENFAMELFNCLIGILGGIILLFESCVLFTGNNTIKKVPILALAVPLWACIRLTTLFTSYTKVSIKCTEMFDLISVALLLMFLLYQSMFFAEINKSSSSKKIIVYGMAFVMSTVVVIIDLIIKKTYSNELTINNILSYVCDTALCGYTLSLITSIFRQMKKNTEDNESINPQTKTAISDQSDNKFDISDSNFKISLEYSNSSASIQNEVIETVVEPVVQKNQSSVAENTVEETAEKENLSLEEEQQQPVTEYEIVSKEEEQSVTEDKTVYQEEYKPVTENDDDVLSEQFKPIPSENIEHTVSDRPPVDLPPVRTSVRHSVTLNKTKQKEEPDSDYDDIMKMIDEMSSEK